MRRRDLRNRLAVLLAVSFLVIGAAGPVVAATGAIADDRPPLLASEPAPDGAKAASRLVDYSVVRENGAYDVVLRADGGLPYQVFKLENPERLVIDLPGVRNAVDRSRAEVGSEGLTRVRVGLYRETPEPVTRVVLEMKPRLAYSVAREGDALHLKLAGAGSSVAAKTETVPAALKSEPAPAKPTAIATAPPKAEPAAVAPKAEPKPEIKTEIKPEPQPETRAEVKPEIKAEAKPEIKAEPKPEIKAEPNAAPVAQVAPAPKPETATKTDAAPVQVAQAAPAPAPAENAAPLNIFAHRAAPRPASDAKPAEARPMPQQASNVVPAREPAPAAAAAPIATPITQPAPAATQAAPAQAAPARPLNPATSAFAPAVASPKPEPKAEPAAKTEAMPQFETKTIQDQRRNYTGKPISLNLVDADIRQVFGVFHELSGLNFVLDPAVSGTVTIVVDEVPWDQALDLILQNNGLEMVLEGNVIRIAPVVKLAQEAAARKTLREAKELEATPVTITRTLSYAKATDVDKVVRDAILSPKGRVIIDARTNTLIIRDIPDRIDAVDKLLSTLDAETPQVMIEARIVEVSRDLVQDIGIKWGTSVRADAAHGTETNLQFPHNISADYSLNLPKNAGASALSLSFGNVLDSFNLDITLDALETEGYAKRLSSPKVATQNNATAEIEQGVRFPIVNTTATEIQTQFVSASLRLKCTPQITAEGTVILDVEVSNDSPDFVNSVSKIPSINTQRAQTKVLIADGGTTVIGGIFTVNEGKSTSGVPFFKNLPGLGWLFRNRSVSTRNRELLIFITPRIVKSA